MASSTDQNVYDLLEAVRDKASFITFLKALSRESDLADEELKANPGKYSYTSVFGWENGSIGAFLDASAAWLEDQAPDSDFRIQDGPSVTWKEMAEIIYAGKIYE